MPERDYSSRSLIDKLGVKEGARVAVSGIADPAFWSALRARTGDCSEYQAHQSPARENCDVVLLAVEKPADLKRILKAVARIKPEGGLWIVYPKGRKDITEAQVMQGGLAAGLVDNKVASFSATHTALRFVRRVADRAGFNP